MIVLNFKLKTEPLSLRPLFDAKINEIKTSCLFDTGARSAIYCQGQQSFDSWCEAIGGAKKMGKIDIGGLGKGTEEGTLYEIPTLTISDNNNNSITFVKFKVIHLPKKTISCELILPISVIKSMSCVMNYAKKDPELLLFSERDMFYTGYSVEARSLYIFTEDDKEYLNYMESLEDNS